jgi:multidrug efflux system membrane fusion protein
MTAPPVESLFLRPDRTARGAAERQNGWTAARIPGGRRTLVVVLALLAIGLLLWAIRPAHRTRNTDDRFGTFAPMPVGVAKAKIGDIRVTLDALGAVTPLATVTVRPEITGIIQKIDFNEGQMVRAGDALAEIDPRLYQAALDQAKGALARDEAQYSNAQIDLKRYQTLWAQKAISQQVLATQEALVRTDAGTVEADKGAVEAAAVNLAFCRITSPVTGEVGLRQIDVGNYVQAGGTTEIAVVTELQPMSVLFTLPEDDIGRVMASVHAGAKLPVDAYDRSQSTRIASGTLSTVDNEIDPTTGTVKMRALFDNSDNRLFPSQFVNVKLLVHTLHGQVTVPAAAVQHGASGNFVFVVEAGHTVRMQVVNLGPTDGDKIDVTHGLSPGQDVVVDGADRLRDGASVVIPGAKSRKLAPGGWDSGHLTGARHHHHYRNGGTDSAQ